MKKNKGFTLVEILVVMSIIGILAGLTLTASMSSRKVARDGKRKADLEQIRSALEIYRSDCKTYPASITPGSPLVGAGSCVGNTYMDKIPNDPLSGYRYSYVGLANSYTLCAYLETGTTLQTGCGSGNCRSSGSNACYYKVTNY